MVNIAGERYAPKNKKGKLQQHLDFGESTPPKPLTYAKVDPQKIGAFSAGNSEHAKTAPGASERASVVSTVSSEIGHCNP